MTKYTRNELTALCRAVVYFTYADGTRGLVALFTSPQQAEAFCRAKRIEQNNAANPAWTVERI